MITESACTNLKNIADKNLSENVGFEHELVEIKQREDIRGDNVVIITISSYIVRILAFIFYTIDEPLRQHVNQIIGGTGNDIDDEKISDYLSELCNAYCGGVKRDLGHVLPHIGMSTPYILPHSSLNYIDEIRVDLESYKKVDNTKGLIVYGGFAVTTYGDFDLDTSAFVNLEESFDSGEIELF